MIPESAEMCLLQCICRKPKIGPINFVQLITRRGNCQLEQLVSRNSRCAVSKCFQETLGISATEDGLLHRLLVRTTLLAAGYARYDVNCLCYMMTAFGAATPGELAHRYLPAVDARQVNCTMATTSSSGTTTPETGTNSIMAI